jgi:hypothetical protein
MPMSETTEVPLTRQNLEEPDQATEGISLLNYSSGNVRVKDEEDSSCQKLYRGDQTDTAVKQEHSDLDVQNYDPYSNTILNKLIMMSGE